MTSPDHRDDRSRHRRSNAPGSHRSGPRRLGDILDASLRELARGDEARAYAAWARAAGDQVRAHATPARFARGRLTVACESSVWANELDYLGADILARMSQVDPGQPVTEVWFMVRSAPTRQEDEPAAAKGSGCGTTLEPGDAARLRAAAREVRDPRLRAAIETSIRTAGEEDEGPGEDESPQPPEATASST